MSLDPWIERSNDVLVLVILLVAVMVVVDVRTSNNKGRNRIIPQTYNPPIRDKRGNLRSMKSSAKQTCEVWR